MQPGETPKLAYVLKMYPRFSETFIVGEILAHEADGVDVEIFSLRPPADGRFHAALAEVRAPVTYLDAGPSKASDVWSALTNAVRDLPDAWDGPDGPAVLGELLRVPVRDALQALELAVRIRRSGCTHLHAHFGSVATTVARLAARTAGVPYSFTAHAKDIFHDDVDPDDLHRKMADAAAVVTVSDYNRSYLRAQYGPAADRVVRVYNGLDLERFSYRAPSDRPPVIAAVGRLVEKKGFADLLHACAALVARGVTFRCRIVGDGALGPSLAARVAGLGLDDHVALLGARPQDEVRGIVQGAAVLAAPCVVAGDGNRDGLPTVLLEAMALGTPCVSTPVTGIPEVVRDGETGLLVPPHSPAALADALERLLQDAALRTRLARAARRLVEADFDVRRQSRRLRAHVLAPAGVPAPLGSGR